MKAVAQISYDQETGMTIYLSKEEGVYEDASFPYPRIDYHFGLDDYAIMAVPAFEFLENSSYCTRINEQNQFEIFGKVRDGETAKKAYEASLIRVGYALEMSSFGEMEAKKENVSLPLQYFTGDQKDAIARYNMERVDDGLNVEVEYYGGLFSIYASVEKDDGTESPFIKIAKNFWVLLSKAKEIPEFWLAKGQKYDAYGAEDKSSYYLDGYFDPNIAGEDYKRDYEALLRRRGFNVSEYRGDVKTATKAGLNSRWNSLPWITFSPPTHQHG